MAVKGNHVDFMFVDNPATEFLDTLEVSEIQEDIWGICWFQIIADRKKTHCNIWPNIYIISLQYSANVKFRNNYIENEKQAKLRLEA